MSEDKSFYRRAWRESYPAGAAREAASRKITTLLLSREEFLKARYVALYCARPWEIDVAALWRAFPKRCVFPKALPESKAMEFYLISQWEELGVGFANILEPPTNPKALVELNDPSDLILVPGIRFDEWGARIGTGGGFYDRFLQFKKAQRWGVAFSAQLSKERLAQEPTDARMDAVVTDAGFHKSL